MPVNQFPKRLFRCGHRCETWLSAQQVKLHKCATCEGFGRKREAKEPQEAQTDGTE